MGVSRFTLLASLISSFLKKLNDISLVGLCGMDMLNLVKQFTTLFFYYGSLINDSMALILIEEVNDWSILLGNNSWKFCDSSCFRFKHWLISFYLRFKHCCRRFDSCLWKVMWRDRAQGVGSIVEMLVCWSNWLYKKQTSCSFKSVVVTAYLCGSD